MRCLASAAIPGAFPPTMFDVTLDGTAYQELHVDGGAFAQAFLYPSGLTRLRRAPRGLRLSPNTDEPTNHPANRLSRRASRWAGNEGFALKCKCCALVLFALSANVA